jgi:hypothetical protein
VAAWNRRTPSPVPAPGWSDKERAAIDELMASQQLSERAVIRQALAHYQIICRKAHGTYIELPSKMPREDEIDALEEALNDALGPILARPEHMEAAVQGRKDLVQRLAIAARAISSRGGENDDRR